MAFSPPLLNSSILPVGLSSLGAFSPPPRAGAFSFPQIPVPLFFFRPSDAISILL